MPQNPLIELKPEYFKRPALVLYTGRKLYEYYAADLSLLPLVVYYLKTVYNENTYFQTCKRCGRLFRANTANIASFCGEECKKAQVRDNKRRFDEKAKGMPRERAYKTQYMFWCNRMTKLRKSNKNSALLEEAESMFAAFRDEATSRKKMWWKGNSVNGNLRIGCLSRGGGLKDCWKGNDPFIALGKHRDVRQRKSL